MKGGNILIYVATLILIGCGWTHAPNLDNTAEILSPEARTAACDEIKAEKKEQGKYIPLTDEGGFIEKAIVVSVGVNSYKRADGGGIVNTNIPIWTQYEVFERRSGSCWVGLRGTQPTEWIEGKYLRSWIHAVAAQTKPEVRPGDVTFYRSWTLEGGLQDPHSVNGDLREPYPIVDKETSGSPDFHLFYKLLFMTHDPILDIWESEEAWVRADQFELVIYTTKPSLESLKQEADQASKELRDNSSDFRKVWDTMLGGQGVTRLEPTDLGQYAYLCGKLPLRTDTPLTRSQDYEVKLRVADEFDRSVREIDKFIRQTDWRSINNRAIIPASILPSFDSPDSGSEYDLCES